MVRNLGQEFAKLSQLSELVVHLFLFIHNYGEDCNRHGQKEKDFYHLEVEFCQPTKVVDVHLQRPSDPVIIITMITTLL